MRDQTFRAIDECAALALVVDARAGITPLDEETSRLLRQTGKPVFLVGNKVDTSSHEVDGTSVYELGWSSVHLVSAIHGVGVGDLLDDVVKEIFPDGPNMLDLDEGEEPDFVPPVAGQTEPADAEKGDVGDVDGVSQLNGALGQLVQESPEAEGVQDGLSEALPQEHPGGARL